MSTNVPKGSRRFNKDRTGLGNSIMTYFSRNVRPHKQPLAEFVAAPSKFCKPSWWKLTTGNLFEHLWKERKPTFMWATSVVCLGPLSYIFALHDVTVPRCQSLKLEKSPVS